MPRQTKADHRQRWMTNFENAVVEAWPEARSKIDWHAAHFFYNSNMVSDEAAAQYVATRKGKV